MLLMVMLAQISLMSAASWDNIKSYNPEDKTISLYNWNVIGELLGMKLADYKLTKNGCYSFTNCEAEGTAIIYQKEQLFQSMSFKDVLGTARNVIYKIYIEDYRLTKVNDYKETCYNEKREGGDYDYCRSEVTGTHYENLSYWKEYKGESLAPGVYYWRIEGIKPANLKIDWLAMAYGKELNEWAWWNATGSDAFMDYLTPNLTYYYQMDDGAGYVALNEVDALHNLTIPGGHQLDTTAGIIGYGLASNNTDNINTTWQWEGKSQITINMWIKRRGNDWLNNAYFLDNTPGALANCWSNGAIQLAETTGSTNTLGFGIYDGGGWKAPIGTATIPNNTWYMITMVVNSTTAALWYNATLIPSTMNTISGYDGSDCSPSLLSGYAKFNFVNENTIIDEVGFWDRALNASEIAALYTPVQYVNPPVIDLFTALNMPVNYYNNSDGMITFNCSSYGSAGTINLTLIINGLRNYTIFNDTSEQNLSLQITRNFSEGYYNWTCRAESITSNSQITERFFTIDKTPPVVNIINPIGELLGTTNPFNVPFNVSVSDNVGFSNCWYYNGTANNTIVCGANTTISLSQGTYTLIYYANDSAGNQASNSTTFLLNVYNYSLQYPAAVVEGDIFQVYFNITAGNLTSIKTNITYNNVIYEMPGTNNGTFASFNKTLTAPYVTANTLYNISFHFWINGIEQLTGNYSQVVYNAPSLNITGDPCKDLALNFTLRDEANLTLLNGTFEYNIAYGPGANNSIISNYGRLEGLNSFYVCINSTISNNWSVGHAEILYTSFGYVDRRYYLFVNSTLSNLTRNITLYDLAAADQTSFKLEIEDTSLNPYSDKYTALIRWYPDLNEYNVVDMGHTDEKGATIIHVRTEDVDYRIGVYELNGDLIKLANPIRMVCLASPCTYTLKISPSEQDLTSFLSIQYQLDYNYTTKLWSFIFSDSSQKTTLMNLTIWKMTGTEVYPVCSNTISGYTGAISCNTSAYSGTLKGVVTRSASPAIPLTEKIIQTTTTAFTSTYGLWLSLLIGLPIIFILAMMSPIAAVIGGVIALIPALYFGTINITILGGIAVLGGIIIHFLKRIG